MIKAVREYLKKYHMIAEGDTVVAGISGGADSVCLFLHLLEYQKEIPFSLAVVHVNHKIRKDADKDAQYVQKLCLEYQIKFHLVTEDVAKRAKEEGCSEEEAGRRIRYEAFEKTLNEYGGTGKIAVAHNRSDCAETMLFNLFRGTGVAGLCGIMPVNGRIIRPLLCLDRLEIENFLKEQNRTWCIDSTNAENTYTRNKIRNELFPYVQREINQNAISHVAFAASQIAQVREYLEDVTVKAMEDIVCFSNEEARILLEPFLRQPNIIQQQILLAAIGKLILGRRDIGEVHIQNILNLCERGKNGKVTLPKGYCAVLEYGVLLICREKKRDALFFCERVCIPGEIILPDGRKAVFTLITNKKNRNIIEKTYTKWFDYDKIIHYLVFRFRKTGDFLTINTKNQHKSLKEYLIAEKIPVLERDTIPLLADGSHILWVIGRRISQEYKVTDETKRILQVTIE